MAPAVVAGCMVGATAWAVFAAIAHRGPRRRPDVPDGRRLRPLRAPQPVAERFGQIDLGFHPDVAWTAWLAGAGTLLVVAASEGGAGLAAVAAALWAGVTAVLWAAFRHRAAAHLEAAVPAALDAVARGLRSGASLLQALREAGAAAPPVLGADLAAVTTAAEHGLGLVPALEDWAVRRPLPSVRLAVAALCLGAETGGAQARAVDGVAMTVRQRLGVAGEARALATQARLSALVIAVSPVVFCLMAATADARVGHLLFRTPLGWTLLAAGLTLDGLGATWMASLTRPRV